MWFHYQVPKCWKVIAADGHVQRHTTDCQLCLSVHIQHKIVQPEKNIFVESYLQMFCLTVTTLKPELGKLMYKDHKQVSVHM